jgi:CheY-like chemotaxis protein
MAANASAVVVATSDNAFFDRISEAIASMAQLDGTEPVLRQIEKASDLDSESLMRASAVIIDDKWPSDINLSSVSKDESLHAVRASFADGRAIPAIELVRMVAGSGSRSASAPGPIIIISSESPTLAFTQVALANGVDWIWSNRTDFDKLPAVVGKLQELRSGERVPKADKQKILIVENSRTVIRALEAWLEDDFQVSAVNDDVQSGKKISITLTDAMDHLRANGPFSAAIVDLALTADQEGAAAEQLGTEEAALLSFLQEERSDIGEILTGVLLIKKLLLTDPDMLVIVFSNYVKNPITTYHIKEYLGGLSPNVSIFSKEQSGYRQLYALLSSRLSEGACA